MKRVIDIPEEVKNRLDFGVTYSQDIQAVCEAIGNSTPLVSVLDKIRAEIEAYQSDAFYPDDIMMNKKMVLEIIDKYKAESGV